MRRLIGGWMIFKGTGYMVRGYFLTFSYLPSSQWVSTFKVADLNFGCTTFCALRHSTL